MKKIVLQLLNITAAEYHKMVFNHYHQWCHFQSFDSQDCQKLITSQALFAWWCEMYFVCERKFAGSAMDYLDFADRQTLRDLHRICGQCSRLLFQTLNARRT